MAFTTEKEIHREHVALIPTTTSPKLKGKWKRRIDMKLLFLTLVGVASLFCITTLTQLYQLSPTNSTDSDKKATELEAVTTDSLVVTQQNITTLTQLYHLSPTNSTDSDKKTTELEAATTDSLVVTQQKIQPRPRHKLVDFAIAGFSKTGTTMMTKRLLHHPQVFLGDTNDPPTERHELRHKERKKIDKFFDLYSMENISKHTNLTGTGGKVLNLVVGFKAPEVVRSETFLPNVVKLFPAMDMIVSLRHPVLHFESNYNYKLTWADRNEKMKLVDTKDLIGDCWIDCYHSSHKHACTPEMKFVHKKTGKKTIVNDVCTVISTFHNALSRLALTPMEEPTEMKLLDDHKMTIHPKWSGRLLLMEIGQLGDKDTGRIDQLGRSFEDFLGLEANSFSLRETEEDSSKRKGMVHKIISICDDEHREVRKHLVRIGRRSSRWIKNYLLKSSRVIVPNKDHFLELIEKWEVDPCE